MFSPVRERSMMVIPVSGIRKRLQKLCWSFFSYWARYGFCVAVRGGSPPRSLSCMTLNENKLVSIRKLRIRNYWFSIRKRGFFCSGKEIKGLRGGVHRYVAQVTPQIDTTRAEKDRFRMETNWHRSLENIWNLFLHSFIFSLLRSLQRPRGFTILLTVA